MKKVLSLVALAMISTIMFAVNDGVKATNDNTFFILCFYVYCLITPFSSLA